MGKKVDILSGSPTTDVKPTNTVQPPKAIPTEAYTVDSEELHNTPEFDVIPDYVKPGKVKTPKSAVVTESEDDAEKDTTPLEIPAYKEPEGQAQAISDMDWYAEMKKTSAAESERDAAREKRNKTINAIGDTISSLSNLYFTTQYAPNMYDPKNSMSEKAQTLYDKYIAESRSERDKEMNARAKAAQLRATAAQQENAYNMRAAQLKELAERNRAEAQRRATADKWKKQFNADKLDEYARHNGAMEQIAANKTKAYAKKAERSGGGKGSKANSKGEFFVYDSNGNPVQNPNGGYGFKTKAAADAFAEQNGYSVEVPTSSTSTSTDAYGNTKTTENKGVKKVAGFGGHRARKRETISGFGSNK